MARQWNIPDIRRVMHTGPEWLFHVLADLGADAHAHEDLAELACAEWDHARQAGAAN